MDKTDQKKNTFQKPAWPPYLWMGIVLGLLLLGLIVIDSIQITMLMNQIRTIHPEPFPITMPPMLWIHLLIALGGTGILIGMIRIARRFHRSPNDSSSPSYSLNQDYFRSMAENASNYAVYRIAVDPSHPLRARIVYVSPSIREIMGVRDPLDIDTWFEQIHEDDIQDLLKKHFHHSENASPFVYTVRIFHPEKKEWKWLEIKSSPEINSEGKPLYYNGVVVDITEAKKIQKSLENNEQFYCKTIELIQAVPYSQNYLNEQYDFVGEGITALTGYSPQEFTPALWKSLLLDIELSDNPLHLSIPEAVKQARLKGSGWRADCRIRTRNGQERWLANAAIQITNKQGIIIGSIGVLQDITSRKQIEEELRKSESNYRMLVQNANVIILRMNTEGAITFFNDFAQQFFGFSENEIQGQNIIGTIFAQQDEQSDGIPSLLRKYPLPHDTVHSYEHENIRKNGERVWVVWTHNPICKENGELYEILCIGYDITELKALQEQFRQSQKMEAIGQLAGGVAHDFNNLLMAILGFSDLALKIRELDEPLRKDLIEIRRAGERAADLTRQLLVFSRKQVLKPSILNMNDLILNMNKMLRRLIGEDIELVIFPGDHLGSIKADPGQIEQIVMNLVVNARDAMPKGGKLIIETSNTRIDDKHAKKQFDLHPGEYVLITLTDTGTGIPKENLIRIFDPFFTTKANGTGLGLSTVYGIVKQSGGSISVSSQLEMGTTFKLYFPRIQESTTLIESRIVPMENLEDSRTVLLVEDEEMVRNFISRVLTKMGFTVLEAGYGSEAIELTKQYSEPIHLLITDVVMPKMSGRELADHILALQSKIRVLYISGYTDDTIVHHGILESGIDFLQKPFTPDQLIQKVREIFSAND